MLPSPLYIVWHTLYIMWHTLYTSCDLCSCKLSAKFKAATTNRLGGDAFTRKYIIWPYLGVKVTKMLHSTLYIMWPIQVQSLELLHLMVKEQMHLQENTLFDLDLGMSRPHEMLPSTLYIMWPIQVQSLKLLLLYLTDLEEMHLQEMWRMDRCTHVRTDGLGTDFGTKLKYPFLPVSL